MRPLHIFTMTILAVAGYINRCDGQYSRVTMEELDQRFKKEWSIPAYAAANTAGKVKDLSETEKKVFYYLNLVRLNPKLFASTYAKDYEGTQKYANDIDFEDNKQSLIEQLNKLSAVPILYPDPELYEFAKCQATAMGKKGLMTHDRSKTGCPTGNFAENLSVGKHDALEIVMLFLIDAGSSTLGHRKTCLDSTKHKMGVSIQKHEKNKECAVLDFSS